MTEKTRADRVNLLVGLMILFIPVALLLGIWLDARWIWTAVVDALVLIVVVSYLASKRGS